MRPPAAPPPEQRRIPRRTNVRKQPQPDDLIWGTEFPAELLPGAGIPADRPAGPVAPAARGKFFWVGEEKLYVRGVAYGPFPLRGDGSEVPEPEIVERDFAAMARCGINTVHTCSVPPRWLLDVAQCHGLRVMVAIPVERHIGYLADQKAPGVPNVEQIVRTGVRSCAGHPALFGFSLGNEIPASVVRWFGRRRLERYLERLSRVAREEAKDALLTYVNHPATEFLSLDFLDYACFNVHLETQGRLEAYLARLQNLEIGRAHV